MTYKQYVSYAVFAAEQVIDIYEKKYPDDNRPRKAIDAAKRCIKSPTKKNKAAAKAIAIDAYPATHAVYAADIAGVTAATAANTAAAVYAAAAADIAATYAANAAIVAADAADAALEVKILHYGIDLLKK